MRNWHVWRKPGSAICSPNRSMQSKSRSRWFLKNDRPVRACRIAWSFLPRLLRRPYIHNAREPYARFSRLVIMHSRLTLIYVVPVQKSTGTGPRIWSLNCRIVIVLMSRANPFAGNIKAKFQCPYCLINEHFFFFNEGTY